MTEVKVHGEVEVPEVGTRWVDNQDDSRVLLVNAVEVGSRVASEVRGTVFSPRHVVLENGVDVGRKYGTDLNTFHKVWLPLGQPVAQT